jgi:Fe2+ or Zn2+ uptake regulation protein
MAKNEDLGRTLRKSGYRATGPRIAILAILKKEHRPMSAQEIIDASRRTIDPATVYRTISSLREKGVIRQVDLRQNHAHYEFADPSYQHHVICMRCGRIEGVRHCNVATFERAVLREAKQFAEITTHALEFYGICKKCADQRTRHHA